MVIALSPAVLKTLGYGLNVRIYNCVRKESDMRKHQQSCSKKAAGSI